MVGEMRGSEKITGRSRYLGLPLAVLWISASALADMVGNNLQNFNPTSSGLDFVTVHSSETLKPGIINLGAYLNLAINSLPYVDSSTQGRLSFNDSLTAMDLNVGVGLGPNWDAGLSLPFVLAQTVDTTGIAHGQFTRAGNTEVRLNSKYRLLGDDAGGLAVVGTVNFPRTENNPFTGIGAGPTYNFQVAWDTTRKPFSFGGSLGYRLANPGAQVPGVPIEPIDDQIIFGAAANYHMPKVDTKIILEIIGSLPAGSYGANIDRGAAALELLAGIKHDFSHQLAFHAGAGTELNNGVSSPDWRIYTGVNYTLGPVFSKRPVSLEPAPSRDGPDGELLVSRGVLFEFDSDVLTAESEKVLQELSARIAERSFAHLTIEGHTDSIGSAFYNQALSQRRAEAIRSFLIRSTKLDPKRIEAVGKGEAEPIADNGNFQGRQLNRRVEFRIRR